MSTDMERDDERLTLKVEPEMHRRLKILAAMHGKTMKKFLEDCVDAEWQKLEEHKRKGDTHQK